MRYARERDAGRMCHDAARWDANADANGAAVVSIIARAAQGERGYAQCGGRGEEEQEHEGAYCRSERGIQWARMRMNKLPLATGVGVRAKKVLYSEKECGRGWQGTGSRCHAHVRTGIGCGASAWRYACDGAGVATCDCDEWNCGRGKERRMDSADARTRLCECECE